MDDAQPALAASESSSGAPHERRASGARRALWLLCGVLALGMLTLLGSALAPGGQGRHPFSVVRLAGKSAPNPLAGRLKKVYGTDVPASRFGTEVADLEDQGTNIAGEKVSELSPLPARMFNAPVNSYRHYAEHWVEHALSSAASLQSALAAGDRSRAKIAWESTWSDYLHLGAVYLSGEAAIANRAIDGSPGGLPGGSSDLHFTGLHRIEMGLWRSAPLPSLAGYGGRLRSDLARLHTLLAHIQISPLEYATRSHEIIEDAQRDFLSGSEVPWSGQGVLGTAAALAATEEVFHTLQPLLDGRENTEGEVRSELLMLRELLSSIREHNHGRYPSLQNLDQIEHERLNGTVAGALSALRQMPGTLETEAHHPIPKLAAGK